MGLAWGRGRRPLGRAPTLALAGPPVWLCLARARYVMKGAAAGEAGWSER